MAILTYVVAVNVSYFFVLKPIWSRLNVLVEKKSVIQDFLVVRESAAAVSAFKDGLMHGDQRMTVVAEFEDNALLAAFAQAGEGLFVFPTVIEDQVRKRYQVRVLGRIPAVRERFFVISVERKLKHPAVVAISDVAQRKLFAD